MTNSSWPSAEAQRYETVLRCESRVRPGVWFEVSRMSFGRRTHLLREVRAIGARLQFLQAGDSAEEQLEAGIVQQEMGALYLRWGLLAVHGLLIDGTEATPEALLNAGPEDLCSEALALVRAQCGLSETERKN